MGRNDIICMTICIHFFTSLVTNVTIVFMVALFTNTASTNNDYFVELVGQKVPIGRHYLT